MKKIFMLIMALFVILVLAGPVMADETTKDEDGLSKPATRHTLWVDSSPALNYISVSPLDHYSSGSGYTPMVRFYDAGTKVTLSASMYQDGEYFAYWTVDGSRKYTREIEVTMDQTHYCTVYWDDDTIPFRIFSYPDSGVDITVSPGDIDGDTDGTTTFTRYFRKGSSVTLTAPATFDGMPFEHWYRYPDHYWYTRKVTITVSDEIKNIAAYYTAPTPTHTLTVKSTPDTGVPITVTPRDNNSDKNGTTDFVRVYDEMTEVTLTAPATHDGNYFAYWDVGTVIYTTLSVDVTMRASYTAKAKYIDVPPMIKLNREELYFACVQGGAAPAPQTILISNVGGGTLEWEMIQQYTSITASPTSGSGDGIVSISMDPAGLAPGNYAGSIRLSSDNAFLSPFDIDVYVTVLSASQNQAPIGDFATPADGAVVSSSVAATGWVVDDTGVESVKMYIEHNGGLTFIGDAVFVDGARSDITAAYSTYPASYQAGWGYMMLTNFLPFGDGQYTLHAIATDYDGKQTDLGTKTITVDNANAVKPFGAIDTPAQGGTASGNAFSQVGWVLTPMPNTVPTDGSTIDVYVNGKNIGHPTYNIYREDIAAYFPNYNNSGGSLAKFVLDTTSYDTGIHSIFWIATDNAGNADGIGSRFFTIQNSTAGRTAAAKTQTDPLANLAPLDKLPTTRARNSGNPTPNIPMDNSTPLKIEKGFLNAASQLAPADKNGISHIRITENEPLVIDLSPLAPPDSWVNGYMVTGSKLNVLPIGSTLDRANRKFYWLPVAGFMGDYTLSFIVETETGKIRKDVRVTIDSKFDKK